MLGVSSLPQPNDADSVKTPTLPRIKIRLCRQCGAQNTPEQTRCPQCGEHQPSPILVYPKGLLIREKYEIISVIGHGAMGTVYRGRHQILKRDVALKFIHPHLLQDTKQIERLRREAVAASAIDHPNALRVLDIDETEDGLPFLVTEFLEGRDLDKCIRAGEEFPPERIVNLLSQALEALAVAHEKGLVHRDLKPHNLFLIKDRDGKERIKLVDFGLAKLLEKGKEERDLTTQGTTLGTPFYMSPEQVRGEQLDPRSDLWAMGVILYQLLTGSLPFSGENPMSTAMAVLKDELIPPSKRNKEKHIQKGLEALCLKALSRNREARPQSALAFREELLRAASQPESPRRHTPASLIAFPAPNTNDVPLRPPKGPRASLLVIGAGLGVVLLFGVALFALWPSSPSNPTKTPKTSLASSKEKKAPALPEEPTPQEANAPEPSTLAAVEVIPVPDDLLEEETREKQETSPKISPKAPQEEKKPAAGAGLPPGKTNLSYGKQLFHVEKDYARAIPYLEAAAREKPDANTYLMLGDAYSKVGQTAKAKEAWEKFLKIAPKSHAHIRRVETALGR